MGCPSRRCAQSCPYQPFRQRQKPMWHSPRPLHWFTHACSTGMSQKSPTKPSVMHGHLQRNVQTHSALCYQRCPL